MLLLFFRFYSFPEPPKLKIFLTSMWKIMFSVYLVAIGQDLPVFKSSGEIKKHKGNVLPRCIAITLAIAIASVTRWQQNIFNKLQITLNYYFIATGVYFT